MSRLLTESGILLYSGSVSFVMLLLVLDSTTFTVSLVYTNMAYCCFDRPAFISTAIYSYSI